MANHTDVNYKVNNKKYEQKGETLTENWRSLWMKETNQVKEQMETSLICLKYIYSLLIYKDMHESQNVSIKFL